MDNKPLILILGRTGSGKDTLARLTNLKILKSYTTRPRRPDEQDTHIFVSPEFYEQHKSEVVAYTEINNYIYFCTASQLLDADIYIIDPYGAQTLNISRPTVSIYIDLDYETRKLRATSLRKDSLSTFESRNASESPQFDAYEAATAYDYKIYNADLQTSLSQLNAIIKHVRKENTDESKSKSTT